MQERLKALAETAKQEILAASSVVSGEAHIESLRVKYLGKKGELSAVLGGMGKLNPEERRSVGEIANRLKSELEGMLSSALQLAEAHRLAVEIAGPPLDVSLPGLHLPPGTRHPVSQTLDDIVSLFARMGFEVASGPEIELDFYNFEALNIPKNHPARDMQDTFYVDADWLGPAHKEVPVLLRTHTSPVQIRTMLERNPPLRCIMPGRVYRRDSDLTHTPMFHQVEGLVVDSSASFAQLRGVLDAFVKGLFGSFTKTRFRPSFFPFTEPSAEVDMTCGICGGTGCRVCKMTGWVEVLGGGMVHPNVFASVHYDSAHCRGFAFGLGVERITLLRHRMDDLRMVFENDWRFLKQF